LRRCEIRRGGVRRRKSAVTAIRPQAGRDSMLTGSESVAKPIRAFGGFYSMALDTFVAMFKPHFAWREYIAQSWFVARVSLLPTLLLTIPYTVLLTFIENILLTEIGASDFSGTGAALGSVRQIGPIVT